MDVKDFVPRHWRDQFVQSAGLPTAGCVRDPDGVVHEIIGDYTACDQSWVHQYGATARKNPRWRVVEGCGVTCFVCLCSDPMKFVYG